MPLPHISLGSWRQGATYEQKKATPMPDPPRGDDAPDGDADHREHLALARRIDAGSADTDTDRSQPGHQPLSLPSCADSPPKSPASLSPAFD